MIARIVIDQLRCRGRSDTYTLCPKFQTLSGVGLFWGAYMKITTLTGANEPATSIVGAMDHAKLALNVIQIVQGYQQNTELSNHIT